MRDATYLDFPLAEYEGRFSSLQGEMLKAGLAARAVCRPGTRRKRTPDIAPLRYAIWGTRGMANIDLLASTVREFGLGAANIGLEFGQFRRPLTNAVGNAAGIYIGHGIGFSVHELPTIQQKT